MFIFLIGCANKEVGIVVTPMIQTQPVNMDRFDLQPIETETSQEEILRPTLIKTKEPTQKVIELPTETPIIWKLCSPLVDHEIESLFQIISSPYNPPPMGKDDRHQGVDFAYYNQDGRASIQGEEIQAILGGWVAAVLENKLPYGNMVMIETPYTILPTSIVTNLEISGTESLYHSYAHMEFPAVVELGQWVDCGDFLGRVGKTGYNIPVAHLHLETRLGPSGWRFTGIAYYDTQATEEERNNYEVWRMSGVFRHFDPMLLFSILDE